MRIISNDGLVDIPYESSFLMAMPMEDFFSVYDSEETPYEIYDCKNGIFLKRVPSKAAAQYILKDIRRRYFDSVGHPKKDERLSIVNLDDYDNVIISERYKMFTKGE